MPLNFFITKMNDAAFIQIKKEYDNFYRALLQKGKLPMWSTQKGFWNAAISDEVYSAFKKIGLHNFKNFLDVGSGDGKVVLIASLFCKNAEGIEIDSFLHSKALQMKMNFGINNAVFHNNDFFLHDFSKYDILFSSPDAPLERGLEKKLLSEMINNVHQQFRNVILESRKTKITLEQLNEIADGRVLTGEQALKVGLVDILGNFQDAVLQAKNLAGIKEKPFIIWPKTKRHSLLQFFIEESAIGKIAETMLLMLSPIPKWIF